MNHFGPLRRGAEGAGARRDPGALPAASPFVLCHLLVTPQRCTAGTTQRTPRKHRRDIPAFPSNQAAAGVFFIISFYFSFFCHPVILLPSLKVLDQPGGGAKSEDNSSGNAVSLQKKKKKKPAQSSSFLRENLEQQQNLSSERARHPSEGKPRFPGEPCEARRAPNRWERGSAPLDPTAPC